MAVTIAGVEKFSPADQYGIRPGEILKSINRHEILDVLDYRFYMMQSDLRLVLQDQSGAVRSVHVVKDEYRDLGLEFDTYLMDSQRRCKNGCIFCFIDQMPPGMRESLYFKDDDSRLSFLFGNYITLTNLTEREVNRILEMHISPVNVSVHTTNPQLRVKMMKNKFAGESLQILKRLAQAGIKLNCQLVLCPGINDGPELERSLADLGELHPSVQSIAVVPVGLTKFRENLSALEGYDAQSAAAVLKGIERYGGRFLQKYGTRLCYASDEFYLKAGQEMPEAAFYEEFLQLENGVGMFSLLRDDFMQALTEDAGPRKPRNITLATGIAAKPLMDSLVGKAAQKWEHFQCHITSVRNDFFGPSIDVAGLLTGQDLIAQLRGMEFGEELLLPASIMRQQGDITLDGYTAAALEKALNIPIRLVPNDGYAMLNALKGCE